MSSGQTQESPEQKPQSLLLKVPLSTHSSHTSNSLATHSLVRNDDDSSGDVPRRPTTLNAYGLTPSTVPPFALEAQFKKLKLREAQIAPIVVNDANKHFKDPFLVSYDGKWAGFVQNIGSNAAYSNKTKGLIPENRGSCSTETGSSSDASIGEEKLYSTIREQEDEEKKKVKQEVFANLNGSWGGGERLEAIFNAPILDDYEFKNQKDRNEWSRYISQVKTFYYGSRFKNQDGKIIHDVDSNEGKFHDFLEKQKLGFRRKKRYWAQLEQRKKQQWEPMMKKLLLDNQYLPLSFRIVIGILCIISLGLAVRIFQNSHSKVHPIETDVPQQPSTIMAICVNSIAVLYLVYIGYDEFSGKPLGLRNPLSKLRLILLDLLFIIFSSANLSLTFNTLYDSQWVCTTEEASNRQLPRIDYICRKQRALAAFLFMVLFMWVTTFTISIVRVVEKVSSSSPR